MLTEPKVILTKFTQDLTAIVSRIMIEAGVEANSNLIKSIEWIEAENGIAMLANDYYIFVSTGRRPRARKVPIENLIEWVKRYNIGSGNVNNTAWAIQQSIYKNGIRGKNYADTVDSIIGEFSADKLADFLAEELADEFVKSLEPISK